MFLKIPGIMSAMTSGEAARRKKLGETITKVRKRQRITVDAAAARAQMSATTWQRVEDGKTVRTLTYRGIEDVLGLRRGILDEVSAGTAPLSELNQGRPASPGQTISTDGLTGEDEAVIRRMVAQLAEARRKDEKGEKDA